jgi:hypothetical protein
MSQGLVSVGAYAALFVAFTLGVGHLLRTRGRVFLDHVFTAKPDVAAATNFLLNVGFYLVCSAVLLVNVSIGGYDGAPLDIVRSVAGRLGWSVGIVALLHGINVVVLAQLIAARAKSADRPAGG